MLAISLQGQTGASLVDAAYALEHGRPAEAAVIYEQTLHHAAPSSRLSVQLSLVTAYLEMYELRRAEELLQSAAHEAGVRTGGRPTAEFYNARGSLESLQGRLNAAEASFIKAREALVNVSAVDDLAADISANVAAIQMRTGRLDAAAGSLKLAMNIWEFAPASDRMVRAKGAMGTLQFLKGRPEEARLWFQQATESAQRLYGSDSETTAALWDSYAMVLGKLKRKGEAKAARRQARASHHGVRMPAADQTDQTIDARQTLTGTFTLRVH